MKQAEQKVVSVQEEQKKLTQGFLEAKTQLEDIVRKQYLYRLQDMKIQTLPQDMAQINDLRLFKVTEMVYQKGEFSPHKFATSSLLCKVWKRALHLLSKVYGEERSFISVYADIIRDTR